MKNNPADEKSVRMGAGNADKKNALKWLFRAFLCELKESNEGVLIFF